MLINNSEYFNALENIKSRIKITQYRAALGANKELMELYWNIEILRRFAETYPDFTKSQRGVDLLPWRNNITLFSKIKDEIERNWYIEQSLNE
ncbi:MAG: DUF1016 N-terminal domain-containing protein [Defluviitaleaceae bacterium]|nr:DUF1016 N-terminal domain-containing protein [Defluviitaleaceae bacterium]